MIEAKRAAEAACAGALGTLALFLVSCRSPNAAVPRQEPVIDLTRNRAVDGFGETRRIEFGVSERSDLLEGWSANEYDHTRQLSFVWATALEASVMFRVLQVEDQQFLVKMCAFPTVDPQIVTVLVNGREVSRFTAAPVFLEYRFVVPAGALSRGENRLTFRHSLLSSHPNHLEVRRFAAAYNSILIGPQCLPLRGWGLPPRPRVHRQDRGRSTPAVLVVTGPAVVHRRLRVPPGSSLRYQLTLPPGERSGAVSTLRIRDGDSTHEMAETTLSRSLFGYRSRDMEVDLSPWSGRTIDLELEISPMLCRSSVVTVVIERAGIFGDTARRV
jgi:hypothetical protein